MSSETSEPRPSSPPPRMPVYAPPPPPRGVGILGCLLVVSMFCNVLAVVVLILVCFGVFSFASVREVRTSGSVDEELYSGVASATDKIAIVHLNGVIMEGALDFVHKEIERAATDNNVKAVVFRIDSPGGSITASDDLYHRLIELRDGNPDKKYTAKPLIVSMAALAASGGYYVAMPGKPIFAERTTMTGSIGVFASFPNVKGLSEKVGFAMKTIKQGEIKDSGSPFAVMTDKEAQVWQDLVDTAYNQFLNVVETGRPKLKGKLVEPITIRPVNAGPPDKEKKKPGNYQRYRADGGIFTADKAFELGLVDQIGMLSDAIKEAKNLAGLSETYKAVEYEKPKNLMNILLGVKTAAPGLLDPCRLGNGLVPRMWYLAPGCDLTGFLAASAAD